MSITKVAELLDAGHGGGNQKTEEEKPSARAVANSNSFYIWQI